MQGHRAARRKSRFQLTRRMTAAIVLILAIARVRRDRHSPAPITMAKKDEPRPKRLFGRVLPWLEAATSIATVAALLLTYQALRDSSAQLEIGRQQVTNAREAAQPTFQLRFLNRAGVDCTYSEDCDPTRIGIQEIGAAEQVTYSVNERLLFSHNASISKSSDDVYLSPWLNIWQGENNSMIWTLGGPSKLPRDLQEYSLNNFVTAVYVVDAFYTDIFGIERQKQWVLSPNFDGLVEQQNSVLDKCNSGIFKDPFRYSPDSADIFDRMIASSYDVEDLVPESARMPMLSRSLAECV